MYYFKNRYLFNANIYYFNGVSGRYGCYKVTGQKDLQTMQVHLNTDKHRHCVTSFVEKFKIQNEMLILYINMVSRFKAFNTIILQIYFVNLMELCINYLLKLFGSIYAIL